MLTVIQAQSAVQGAADQDPAASQAVAEGLGFDLQGQVLKPHDVIVAHDALVLNRENLVQFRAPVRDKRRARLLRRDGELVVVDAQPPGGQKGLDLKVPSDFARVPPTAKPFSFVGALSSSVQKWTAFPSFGG